MLEFQVGLLEAAVSGRAEIIKDSELARVHVDLPFHRPAGPSTPWLTITGREAVASELREELLQAITPMRVLSTGAATRAAHHGDPALGASLSAASLAALGPEPRAAGNRLESLLHTQS